MKPTGEFQPGDKVWVNVHGAIWHRGWVISQIGSADTYLVRVSNEVRSVSATNKIVARKGWFR